MAKMRGLNQAAADVEMEDTTQTDYLLPEEESKQPMIVAEGNMQAKQSPTVADSQMP